ERLRRAMILETTGLLEPVVAREEIELAHPRLLAGSKSIRTANLLAASGNWPAAEQAWLDTLQAFPNQPAGWINASIAAAARQDFELAKNRLAEALRCSATSPANATLASKTLVWVELQQRQYHAAFDLPEPHDGWRVTRPD
ncbi:MAG: hypothetical protein AAF539_16935, partial [Planctomycetota bacterium]